MTFLYASAPDRQSRSKNAQRGGVDRIFGDSGEETLIVLSERLSPALNKLCLLLDLEKAKERF